MPTTATMPEPPPGAHATRATSTSALTAGARLGNYRLVALIGFGGMANVWAAARTGDYGFERLFAVKVMRDEIAHDPAFRRMFLDEAKVSARIHHTNVVDVIDLGEDAGTVYQVMPLVEGDSLARLLHAKVDARRDSGEPGEPDPKVPLSVAARIVVDTLRGLHAAHETRSGRDGEGSPLGIVHRDVSPQNILVGIDGVAKIADFGVAKVTGALGVLQDENEAGAPKGKVSYMSPEQLAKGALDRRSDVFSTGVVLWELLVGGRLTPTAARRAQSREPIASPTSRDAAVPEALSAVAMRALAASVDDRYASADAMADALESAARGCGLALSTKEVASWASARATKTLTRRREQLAEALGTLAAAATASEIAPPLPARASGRWTPRRAGVAVAASIVAVVVAVAAFAVRAPAPRVAASASPPAVEELAAAPSAAPPAVATPSAIAPPAAPPSPSAPIAGPRPSKRAPRPTFGNPYAR